MFQFMDGNFFHSVVRFKEGLIDTSHFPFVSLWHVAWTLFTLVIIGGLVVMG